MPGLRRTDLSASIAKVPSVVRYILLNAAIGSALGAVLALLFVATDVAGLRTLLTESSDPAVPLLLFAFGFATLFGSLYAGCAIMALPEEP